MNRQEIEKAVAESKSLQYADLRHANLWDADLRGAKLNETGFAVFQSTYACCVYPDGRMQYGCEIRTLDEWERLAGDLSLEHEPSRAEDFEAEIRALIALARVLSNKREGS